MRLLDPSSPSLGAAALLLLSSLPNGLNCAEAAKSKAKDAVLLSNIKSLTLQPNAMTTSRRLPPIPQLTCLPSPSSPLCRLALPHISIMRCVNQGPRYGEEDIQWSCTVPSLPTTLQLGSTDVICEGYDGPDDNYVLKGSCGVEFRVILTEEGRRRYGEHYGDGGGWGEGGEGTGLAGYLFGVLFVGVLGWIVYSACVQAGANRRPGANGERRGWGGGGGGPGFGGGPGGGPGGDWDEPPPPYPGYGNKPSGSQQQQPGQQQQGWRPGFWSGVAGGAAAGYLAGQRGRGREDRNRGYNYGSTWGGSSSGSRNRSWGSSSSPSYSGDNSGSSGATHESTGFGSTSRR